MRSFEVALAHGVDAIEFDVLDLIDGPLVVAHSRAELAAEPLSLDDALDFLRAHDVAVHVDLKLTTRLDEVAAALRRHELLERAVVSSFHLGSLRAIAAAAPRSRSASRIPRIATASPSVARSRRRSGSARWRCAARSSGACRR